MHTFVALQSTYETIQIGVFQNDVLVDFHESHKYAVSKELIAVLVELLEHRNILLQNLDFIAVNIGPGPFTTVRALLATVNGINFAAQVPLVGIDGLALLIENYTRQGQSVTALINAFNNDVYFGYQRNGVLVAGWDNIELALKSLPAAHTKLFVGNGAQMHRETIQRMTPQATIIDAPSNPSIEELGACSIQMFKLGHTQQELLPLYVKKIQYKTAM